MSRLLHALGSKDVNDARSVRNRNPVLECVASLYVAGPIQYQSLVNRFRRCHSSLLEACAGGQIKPALNKVQEKVSELLPGTTQSWIYVNSMSDGRVMKRLAIRKHNGLWRIVSRRASSIEVHSKSVRGGIVTNFPWPENEGPTFERVLGRNSDILGFPDELLTSVALQRQL